MALLKFRAVVVLPLPFKWSGGPSKGEGGGCRSVVLIHRLTDLKTREAALLIEASNMSKDVRVAALLKMREVVLLKVGVVVL